VEHRKQIFRSRNYDKQRKFWWRQTQMSHQFDTLNISL
jgi:hypothetical protein